MDESPQVSPLDIMGDFEEEPTRLEDFPEEVRDDVEGLVWLGYLEDEFEFCGHNFVIRTLRGDEELLASLVTKEFNETLGADRAFAWAIVSLALVAVDGDTDFCPPASKDKRAYARARFQYCTSRWFWTVGDFIFQRYAALQVRQSEALQRVEDLSQGSLHTSSPSASSSQSKGGSEKPLDEIKDYLEPQDSTGFNDDFSPSTSSS